VAPPPEPQRHPAKPGQVITKIHYSVPFERPSSPPMQLGKRLYHNKNIGILGTRTVLLDGENMIFDKQILMKFYRDNENENQEYWVSEDNVTSLFLKSMNHKTKYGNRLKEISDILPTRYSYLAKVKFYGSDDSVLMSERELARWIVRIPGAPWERKNQEIDFLFNVLPHVKLIPERCDLTMVIQPMSL